MDMKYTLLCRIELFDIADFKNINWYKGKNIAIFTVYTLFFFIIYLFVDKITLLEKNKTSYKNLLRRTKKNPGYSSSCEPLTSGNRCRSSKSEVSEGQDDQPMPSSDCYPHTPPAQAACTCRQETHCRELYKYNCQIYLCPGDTGSKERIKFIQPTD